MDTRWCRNCKEYHELSTALWLIIPSRTPRCRRHYTNTTARWRSANKEKVRTSNKNTKATPGTKYSMFKSGANKRKLEVDITLEHYTSLIQQLCHYCGVESQIGIDRIDNSLGYLQDNCLPCCTTCNLTRNNLYTYAEFKQYIAPGIKELNSARNSR